MGIEKGTECDWCDDEAVIQLTASSIEGNVVADNYWCRSCYERLQYGPSGVIPQITETAMGQITEEQLKRNAE